MRSPFAWQRSPSQIMDAHIEVRSPRADAVPMRSLQAPRRSLHAAHEYMIALARRGENKPHTPVAVSTERRRLRSSVVCTCIQFIWERSTHNTDTPRLHTSLHSRSIALDTVTRTTAVSIDRTTRRPAPQYRHRLQVRARLLPFELTAASSTRLRWVVVSCLVKTRPRYVVSYDKVELLFILR